jgi:hypothetical protein
MIRRTFECSAHAHLLSKEAARTSMLASIRRLTITVVQVGIVVTVTKLLVLAQTNGIAYWTE